MMEPEQVGTPVVPPHFLANRSRADVQLYLPEIFNPVPSIVRHNTPENIEHVCFNSPKSLIIRNKHALSNHPQLPYPARWV